MIANKTRLHANQMEVKLREIVEKRLGMTLQGFYRLSAIKILKQDFGIEVN